MYVILRNVVISIVDCIGITVCVVYQ